MLRSSRHQPRTFWEWFDQNVKFVFVALTAVGAAALVMIAINSAPRVEAGTVAGPIPTFGTAQQAPTRVVFLGDSYTAGAGSSSGAKNFVSLVAKANGWQATNLGRGGTGYITTAGKDGCGLDYCPSYAEMIPDAVKANPSIVVVSGGRNDGDRAGLADGIAAFYASLRTALPDAKIIATSPIWDDDAAPASINATRGYVKSAVASVGGTSLDIGEPLVGHADLIGPDGVHPNDDGYAVIAAAVSKSLTEAR